MFKVFTLQKHMNSLDDKFRRKTYSPIRRHGDGFAVLLWNNRSGAFLIRVLFEYVSIVIALPQAGLEPLAESSILSCFESGIA